MYTLAAFLRLFLLFSLPLPPCCCFEGSVVRGFAVGNGALLPSPLSLSLSREESSSFYELAAISGTNDSSWVEIYSYRYRIGVTRGVTSITSWHTARDFRLSVQRGAPLPLPSSPSLATTINQFLRNCTLPPRTKLFLISRGAITVKPR